MVPFFLGTPCRRHQSDTNAGKVQPAGAGWIVQGTGTSQAGKGCVCMERASLRPQAAPTQRSGTTDQGAPRREGTTATPCLQSTGPRPRLTDTPPGRGCGRAAQGRNAGMARNFLEEDTRRDSRTGGGRRAWRRSARPEGPLAEDGMQERRTVSLLRMKGWTRPPPPTAALTLPPTRKKRRRNFFRPSIYDTQPSDRTLRRVSLLISSKTSQVLLVKLNKLETN